MLVMDRENPYAAGWSHVCSTAPSAALQLDELEHFRRRVGAPQSALQRPTRAKPFRRLHLDLRGKPRLVALGLDGTAVRVFPSAMAMMRFLRTETVADGDALT